LKATGRVPDTYHVAWGPELLGPFTRDESIRFQEDEDRQIQQFEEGGMNSFLGHFVIGIKPHCLKLFRAYNLEVAYRNERAKLYTSTRDLVANGSISAKEMVKIMNDFDTGETMPEYIKNYHDDKASNEYSYETFVKSHFPSLDMCDNKQHNESISAPNVEEASENAHEAEAEAVTASNGPPKRTRAELLDELDDTYEDLNNFIAEKKAREAAEAAAQESFALPEEFPFQEDIASMAKDRQAEELKNLASFMGSLTTKAAKDELAERRAAGEFDAPTLAQRNAMIEKAGKTSLVHFLLTCSIEE
jgi:hypothetical protein